MILYNIRSKGPYEYDKFILNILQFHNDISALEDKLNKEEIESLNHVLLQFLSLFNQITSESSLTSQLLLHKYSIE